jgi:hypothetical protein
MQTQLNRLIPHLLAPLIGAVFRQGGLRRFPFFQTLRFAPLHCPIVRMRLLMVLGARTAKKEQNLLSVATAHTVSFRNWQVVVKRSTVRDHG